MNPSGVVLSVSRDSEHRFTKPATDQVTLVAGLGVAGDAHFGSTVQHRSRVAVDPDQPNLRQVHLIHSELFAEVAADGFSVSAGQMGENITTTGIDLLALPTSTVLHLGDEASVEVTGLRNPCAQINSFESGLLKSVLGRDSQGRIVRKAGIMSVVLRGGTVRPGDSIAVEFPPAPHHPLEWV